MDTYSSHSQNRLGGPRSLLRRPQIYLTFAVVVLLLIIGIGIWVTASSRKSSVEVSDVTWLRTPELHENEIHGGEDFDSGIVDSTRVATASAEASASNRGDDRIASLQLRLAAIASEDDPIAREQLLQLAINSIEGSINLNAIQLVQKCEDSVYKTELLSRLVRLWAESDPKDAARAIEQLSAPLQQEAVNAVATAWSNSDLAAAVAWTQQMPDETERVRATLAVASEAVRTDPVQSLELVSDLPPGSQRDELILRAAVEWFAREAEPALAWARQIESCPLREQLIAGIAVAWAETNPVDAAKLAIDELEAGRLRSDAIVSIAQRWAQQSPEQAAAWIERFPPGELKLAATDNVAKVWAQHNPSKAEQWRARAWPK